MGVPIFMEFYVVQSYHSTTQLPPPAPHSCTCTSYLTTPHQMLISDVNVNISFYVTGNALHSFSFAAVPYKGSFCNLPEPGKLQASMSASWQFFNYVSGAGTATNEPIVVRNPVSTSYHIIVIFKCKTCVQCEKSVE